MDQASRTSISVRRSHGFRNRSPYGTGFSEAVARSEDRQELLLGEVWEPDVTENVADNDTDNDTDVTEGVTEKSTSEKRRDEILCLMKLDKKITYDNLVNILHVSRKTIARDIGLLHSQNRLLREGEDHGGSWIVIEESK